jgi:hypothetical protein
MIGLLLLSLLIGCQAMGATSVGSVVRSKEWIVRRGLSREEEFKGDVRYESAGTKLSADWALFRHEKKDWQARGNVYLRRRLASGDLLEAEGYRANYVESTQSGSLEPAPGKLVSFRRTPADGTTSDHGNGDRLDWTSDRFATITGHARVWGPRMEVWSDQARWDRLNHTLNLIGGRPVLRKVDEEGGWTTALKADAIEASHQPRRIEAHGKVVGWIIFKDAQKFRELSK